jgi:aspartate-semialdehyde dehydrogenase
MISVAVVGATGMVGQTFITVLEEYQLPIGKIVFLASERSKGKTVTFNGKTYPVEVLDEHSFDQSLDYALFSAGGDTSKKYAPIAAAHGVTVIDNSSAWRMDPTVPLVVPEVNPEAAYEHHGIIANPNCSTIQSVIPLQALKPWGLKRVVYSTYQAVSGSGYKGVSDLKANLSGNPSTFYPTTILHNVLPHIDVFLPNGATKEEEKMVNETRKILGLPSLRCTATCVRVPVFNGHSVAINVELEKPFALDDILNALEAQAGLKVLREGYPTPLDVSGQDLTMVGRVRRDESLENGLNLWVVADNIRKGAASNAIQIMQKLMEVQS